jgi:hypothetical protein
MAFFRELIVLPITFILFLNQYLKVFKNLSLFKLRWKIGGRIDDACHYITLLAKEKGLREATSVAEQLLIQHKNATIASHMGFLIIQLHFDFNGALEWVKKAEYVDADNLQILLLLKLYVYSITEHPEREQIIEEILSRNDLPASYTLAALIEKAECAIEKGDWQIPEQAATYILSIMEYPIAHWLLWMCRRKNGLASEAEKELNILKKNIKEPRLSFYIGLGFYYLDEKEASLQAFYNARGLGFHFELAPLSIQQFISTHFYGETR